MVVRPCLAHVALAYCAFSAFLPSIHGAAARETRMSTDRNLVIYKRPNAHSDTISLIPKNTRGITVHTCALVAEGAKWCKVSFDQDTGWVQGRYLTPDGERRIDIEADKKDLYNRIHEQYKSLNRFSLNCSIDQTCLPNSTTGCGVHDPIINILFEFDLNNLRYIRETTFSYSRKSISDGRIISADDLNIILDKKGEEEEKISRTTGDYSGVMTKHELGRIVTVGRCVQTKVVINKQKQF